MSDWYERPVDERAKIIGEDFKKKRKSPGGDPSLSNIYPRDLSEYADLLDQFDDNRSPEDIEFLKDLLAWPNRADLGQEGRWPSGETYPTEEDLEWMFQWLEERYSPSKKGFLGKLLGGGPEEVDRKYREQMGR